MPDRPAPAPSRRRTALAPAPDELPHLFDRFFRTEASVRAATPGTGLGPTIARSLVEAHDGTLTVESRVGGGTTFVVSLPTASSRAALRSH